APLPPATSPRKPGLWTYGQRCRVAHMPTGPTTKGVYMIEKCQPCNRSILSTIYSFEPESDLSPLCGERWSKWLSRAKSISAARDCFTMSDSKASPSRFDVRRTGPRRLSLANEGVERRAALGAERRTPKRADRGTRETPNRGVSRPVT